MGCEGTCDCTCTKVIVDPLGLNIEVSCGPGGLSSEGCNCSLSGSTGATSVSMWGADEGILFVSVTTGGVEYHGICEGTICDGNLTFTCGGNITCIAQDESTLDIELVGDQCTFELFRASNDVLLGYIDGAQLPAGARTGNGLLLVVGTTWYGAYLGDYVGLAPTISTPCVLDMTAGPDDLDPTVLSAIFTEMPSPSCQWEGLHHISSLGVCKTTAAIQAGFCDICPGTAPGTVYTMNLSDKPFEASCDMQVWVRESGSYTNHQGVRWYPGVGNRNLYFRGDNVSPAPGKWSLCAMAGVSVLWSENWVQDSDYHTIRAVRDGSGLHWYYDGILKYTDASASTAVSLSNNDCVWTVGADGRYNCSRIYLKNFEWISGQWYQ